MSNKRVVYLVDGYNVIGSWTELKELKGDIEKARDVLIDIVMEYGAFEQLEICIVFDACFTNNDLTEEMLTEYCSIVYTGNSETADSYIERKSYGLVKAGREVYVVTSDGMEQSVVLGIGAYRISSSEFYREIKAAKKLLCEEYNDSNLINRIEIHEKIDFETLTKMEKLRRQF